MLRIVTHIERLLLMHDCVIIPQLGGFVSQMNPAFFCEADALYHPSYKVITFNATLQHNDGLLNESYMQLYQVNYRKAQLMLNEDIDVLKQALIRYKQAEIGTLGMLSLGEEDQLIFQVSSVQSPLMDAYGLPSFHFAPLIQQQALSGRPSKDNSGNDVYYISVNRKWLKLTASVAAAVGLFLLISTPVKDVNPTAYTASFIPSSYNFSEAIVAPNALLDVSDTTEHSLLDKEEIAATTSKIAENEIENTIEKKAIERIRQPKMFHIVIASFPTESQANEFINNVDKNICRNVQTIIRDGKYRIYADKFDNRKAAESYMSSIRNYPQFKDAWLLICR